MTDPVAAELDRALDVLTAALAATDLGAPARMFIAPGEQVAWDRVDQAWVRLVSFSPTSGGVGVEDGAPRPGRTPLAWTLQVELGVLRASPTVLPADGEFVLPAADELSVNARACVADARALRQAVTVLVPRLMRRDVLPQPWAPLGPEGGAAGGAISYLLSVEDCVD